MSGTEEPKTPPEPVPTYYVTGADDPNMFAPEGGSDATEWVISNGADPAEYWDDVNSIWVELASATVYDDATKANENLPSDPPTSLWVDKASIV